MVIYIYLPHFPFTLYKGGGRRLQASEWVATLQSKELKAVALPGAKQRRPNAS